MAGLDGLRGVAVVTVMAFHAGVAAVAGGLLGVDVFFVLSGFLVTSLLLAERTRTGRISLRRFWGRRVRRLLPALFLTLLGVAALARWSVTGVSPARLRGDALSTLFYVANWHYIATGQDYFVRYAAPSPLLHTWSLAVEEQFYLVWPVVALLVLRRWGRRALAWVSATALVASAVETAALQLVGSGVDRMYYGTDTRIQSIMAGALLATVWGSLGPVQARSPRARMLGGAGVAGAVALAWFLHAVRGDGPFLYRGGFLAVAVAAAAVVALTVALPGHPLSRALSVAPLRYVGRISYGLYLYHWPLFLYLTESRTGLSGARLLALRFAATFAAAVLSYHLMESPIRSRLPRSSGRRHLMVATAVAGPLAVAAALVAVTAAPGSPAMAAAVPGRGYSPAAGVDAAHPVRSVLIGDSMALTLGVGLQRDSGAWGVSVDNSGDVGCDLDPDTTVNVEGDITRTAQGCPHWATTWRQLVATENPDVVVVLLGRWECLDRLYGGRWTHVGEPAFDAHLRAELEQVIDIGSSRGAKVVFLTLPYIAETTVQPNGTPWPINRRDRTDAYDADVAAAVSRHPGQATIVDLNHLLDPAGHYTAFIDGIRVRSTDEEHISPAGGEWLRPSLLPAIARAGWAHFHARASGSGAKL